MVLCCGSVHDIYCFQLERFLCRECGKIKCACQTPSSLDTHPATPPSEVPAIVRNRDDSELTKSNTIEYRHPRVYSRQYSGPEVVSDNMLNKPNLAHRASEQPFVRSVQGENGKLRRSFAVRSREGLENLLSFASIRKGHEQGKAKQNTK